MRFTIALLVAVFLPWTTAAGDRPAPATAFHEVADRLEWGDRVVLVDAAGAVLKGRVEHVFPKAITLRVEGRIRTIEAPAVRVLAAERWSPRRGATEIVFVAPREPGAAAPEPGAPAARPARFPTLCR